MMRNCANRFLQAATLGRTSRIHNCFAMKVEILRVSLLMIVKDSVSLHLFEKTLDCLTYYGCF